MSLACVESSVLCAQSVSTLQMSSSSSSSRPRSTSLTRSQSARLGRSPRILCQALVFLHTASPHIFLILIMFPQIFLFPLFARCFSPYLHHHFPPYLTHHVPHIFLVMFPHISLIMFCHISLIMLLHILCFPISPSSFSFISYVSPYLPLHAPSYLMFPHISLFMHHHI